MGSHRRSQRLWGQAGYTVQDGPGRVKPGAGFDVQAAPQGVGHAVKRGPQPAGNL